MTIPGVWFDEIETVPGFKWGHIVDRRTMRPLGKLRVWVYESFRVEWLYVPLVGAAVYGTNPMEHGALREIEGSQK